ncbi:dihydrofolate reductase family protein [uncultured Oscillibacter sp.]|jgi:dihydrofolate reductase|uniref:dihydrofolate reductase family protein n=1 Tax=uncultured Oscillibacter sp. TaxID=876091 RepID=UPI0026E45A91|nr:dihydrofolate reductase family protein [uncultured Oscillibacter sp.]
MERKVILYIAMSLDGYVADSTGGVDWLGGCDPAYEGDYGYTDFFQNISTVLMGWNTYHQVVTELAPGEWPYDGKETYVLTHRKIQRQSGISFVDMPVPELVRRLKTQEGKDIWICGGANIVSQLLPLGLIDEFHLSLMPALLGGGTSLFPEGELHRLKLVSTREENGVVECIYRRV